MTQRARQHKEMEHRVHIPPFVQRVEQCSRDVAYALSHNPHHRCRRHRVNQRLESHQHTQPHADEAESLQIGMLFQPDKAHDGSRYGTRPDKHEEAPAPVALRPQCHQRQRRI